MFKGENHTGQWFSLCCSRGEVKLPPIKDPLEILKKLLTGNSQRDRDFCQQIKAYDSSLAFASMCLTGHEYTLNSKGPYCYRINGQVYHKISQLQPESGKSPGFSQIYIYDQQNELDYHLRSFTNLDKNLLKELQDVIKDINPYAKTYMHVADVISQKPTEDVHLVLMVTRKTVDPRRYNIPTGSDVAVVIPAECQNITTGRDVVIYKSTAHHPDRLSLMNIHTSHPMYDPLMYVLMFPFGDKGWQDGSHPLQNRRKDDSTALKYYRYRLMPQSGQTFNTIHRMGRLFQQYVVDMYAKIECARLSFICHNQSKLRADLYQGLTDAVQGSDGHIDGSQIGKRIILASIFTGSARYQHQLYQDAMAIVCCFGKPDFFITFTCNPKWKEIS